MAHIWIQYGHVLKEQERFASAERAYRQAVALRPDMGDGHLQLGHLLKRLGRRSAAIIAYEAALVVAASHTDAMRELASLGIDRYVRQSFENRHAEHEMGLVFRIADEVAHLRASLDRIAAQLPALSSLTAWPPALYDRFRAHFRPPPPPAIDDRDISVSLFMMCDGVEAETMWRQMRGLVDQADEAFYVHAIGVESEALRVVARMAPSFDRLACVRLDHADDITIQLRDIVMGEGTEWVVLLAKGAIADPQALAWVKAASSLASQVDAWICDEEFTTGDASVDVDGLTPCLRQMPDYDWCLDMGSEGQTVIVRREAFLGVCNRCDAVPLETLRSLLLLDLTRAGRVGHIPLALFRRSACKPRPDNHAMAVTLHARAHGFVDAIMGTENAREALPLGVMWRVPDMPEKRTVVLATRDNVDDLAGMVGSLRRLAERPEALRFVIVDNGSETLDAVDGLDVLARSEDTTVVRIDEPFNWSRLNNLAVRHVDTPLVVFANDDMTMLTQGWDDRVRGLLARPDVGLVGALLLYPDDTIQHAGVLMGWYGNSTHDGLHEAWGTPGPGSRWQVTRTASAVTGAFMAMRCELFRAIGEFDERHLPVGQSDIDLCLRVRKAGFKIVWTPHIMLRHFESKSRGLDHLDGERSARARAELAVMKDRWGQGMENESSVGPSWVRTARPFSLLTFPTMEKIIANIREYKK
nr:glycosyltransferase [Gluconacetobacter tumulisoli]